MYTENLVKLKELKSTIDKKESTDKTLRKENTILKETLQDTNKKFNKLNKRLSLLSDKKNKEFNELLAAVNKKDVVEYKTILKEKIEAAELSQVKEEILNEVTESFQQDVKGLKRYVELASAGGGSNAVQYAQGGIMRGDLEVTGTLKANTLLSAAKVEIGYETDGFNVHGSLSASQGLSANNLDIQDKIGIGVRPERALDMDGHFRLNVSPDRRTGNQYVAQIKSTNGTATSLQVQGPIHTTHDDFKDSGVTGGFADNSNHFHTVTKINRITQQGSGEQLNIERVQEQYYAVQANVIRSSQAAFWNWGRVSREITTTPINLSNSLGWDVSAIQQNTQGRRTSVSQVPFTSDDTTFFRFANDSDRATAMPLNRFLQVEVEIDFEGAIVAAQMYGKVTSHSAGSNANITIYGGNYKSLGEVPVGSTQTNITENFSVNHIDESNFIAVNSSPTTGITRCPDGMPSNYRREGFGYKDGELMKVEFASSSHGLDINDQFTLFTDGTNNFPTASVCFVVATNANNIISDTDSTNMVYFILGRVFEPDSTVSSITNNLPTANIVGIMKGGIDPLHDFTAGDQLMTFFSDNAGRYKSFQLGPGAVATNNDSVVIGYNIASSYPNSVALGYNNLAAGLPSPDRTSNSAGNGSFTKRTSNFARPQLNMSNFGISAFQPFYLDQRHQIVNDQNDSPSGSVVMNIREPNVKNVTGNSRAHDHYFNVATKIMTLTAGDGSINVTRIHKQKQGKYNASSTSFDFVHDYGSPHAGYLRINSGSGGEPSAFPTTQKGGIYIGHARDRNAVGWIGHEQDSTKAIEFRENYKGGLGFRFPGKLGQSGASGSTEDILNRYSQGNFTPTLRIGSSDIQNYNIRKAYFTRIGNLVQISIQIRITNPSTNDKLRTGLITVRGLPYIAQGRQVFTVHTQRGWLNMADRVRTAFVSNGSTTLTLVKTINRPDAPGQGTNQGSLYTTDFLAADGVTNLKPLNFVAGTSTTDGAVRAFYFDIEGSYTTDTSS